MYTAQQEGGNERRVWKMYPFVHAFYQAMFLLYKVIMHKKKHVVY